MFPSFNCTFSAYRFLSYWLDLFICLYLWWLRDIKRFEKTNTFLIRTIACLFVYFSWIFLSIWQKNWRGNSQSKRISLIVYLIIERFKISEVSAVKDFAFFKTDMLKHNLCPINNYVKFSEHSCSHLKVEIWCLTKKTFGQLYCKIIHNFRSRERNSYQ